LSLFDGHLIGNAWMKLVAISVVLTIREWDQKREVALRR